ncbi:MAG TPA: DUF3667 domain-containing protein [Brevundimonas sp.]|nr:DUF3667 domain-containing protein [Brevundimonas sp.]
MDIDAAGGVATAGLVGGAIEKPTGEAGEPHSVCTDCGQPTTGRFCANCGQPTHVHRSLLHLGEEMLHGILHFDARIWRTLPLLAFNPGRLTREWVQGRRTRYVSPLAMYLFTVFLMFFAFSFMGGEGGGSTLAPVDQGIAKAEAELVEARTDLATATAGLSLPADAEGKTYSDAGERADLKRAEREVTRLRAAKAAGQTMVVAGEGWQANIAERARSGELKSNTGSKRLDKIIEKKLLNPDLALYKLQQTTYKFSFLLIPLSIPFIALLFLWKRGFTLYDHGVFVLYSLTAVSILFMGAVLLSPVWAGFRWLFALLITFGIPVHMFAQLKGAYGLRWFSAGWRTLFLLVFANIALGLFFTAIILLGLTS